MFSIANAGVDVGDLEKAMDAELMRIVKDGVPQAEMCIRDRSTWLWQKPRESK